MSPREKDSTTTTNSRHAATTSEKFPPPKRYARFDACFRHAFAELAAAHVYIVSQIQKEILQIKPDEFSKQSIVDNCVMLVFASICFNS